MSESVAERVRKCAKCGFEWVRREGEPEPDRCANPAKRCKDWRGKVEEDHR